MITFREGEVTAAMNLRRSSSPSSQGTAAILVILVSIPHCASSLKAVFLYATVRLPTQTEMGSSVKKERVERHGGLADSDLHNCLIVP
jgi:hypothetical protein